VVVSSDAGDQYGVLYRMMDEIQLWGFSLVMAGNMKGFLDRYATPETIEPEARIRNLNQVQCCGYTDGTKLGIEMALLANATGMTPWVAGMEGPRLETVQQVLGAFDFDKYQGQGVVDYILGAEPGPGVFVVGHCDDSLERGYLKYLKMGQGPYYLFYRPYHLVHLETPFAVASVALLNRPLMEPVFGRIADVYAYAKGDFSAGETIARGLGGAHFYGMIDACERADAQNQVPITWLEEEGDKIPRLIRDIKKDQPLTFDDLELPQTYWLGLLRKQQEMLA
jgi:predicted homoserine dehydrogenase-like protein